MSPFTLLLGRLVDLLGVESATDLVREFSNQTIQFPKVGTNAFGFHHVCPAIAAGTEPLQAGRNIDSLHGEPLGLSAQANSAAVTLPASEGRQPVHSSPVLPRHAMQAVLGRSLVLSTIEFQLLDQTRSSPCSCR